MGLIDVRSADIHSTYNPDTQPWIAQNNLVRTSQSLSRFEGRFFYGLNSEFWQAARNINGSKTYDAVQNGVRVGIDGGIGDAYYDITRPLFFYQPDTVIHASGALVLGTNSNVRRFFGMGSYQSGAIQDGFFLRNEGGQIQFVKVSSTSGAPVETVHAQADWIDPMDGTGESGVSLDFDAIQMAEISFAWYGAGTAYLMFRLAGKTYVADYFLGANSGQSPIIANPCLAVMYGVEGLIAGPAVSFPHWGLSVSVDGEPEETGKAFGVESPEITATGGSWTPIISIRLKSTFSIDGATPKPNVYGYLINLLASVYNSNREGLISIVRSPVLTGASWTDIPDIAGNPVSESMVEYDVSATAITGGIIAYPRAVPPDGETEINVFQSDVISIDSLGGQTALTIAAKPVSGGNAQISAAFSWREVY